MGLQELDKTQLIWAALSDPNVKICMAGVTCALIAGCPAIPKGSKDPKIGYLFKTMVTIPNTESLSALFLSSLDPEGFIRVLLGCHET